MFGVAIINGCSQLNHHYNDGTNKVLPLRIRNVYPPPTHTHTQDPKNLGKGFSFNGYFWSSIAACIMNISCNMAVEITNSCLKGTGYQRN